MRLQYLAGLALNGDHAGEIQSQMLALAKPPVGTFRGDKAVLDQMFSGIRAQRAGGTE